MQSGNVILNSTIDVVAEQIVKTPVKNRIVCNSRFHLQVCSLTLITNVAATGGIIYVNTVDGYTSLQLSEVLQSSRRPAVPLARFLSQASQAFAPNNQLPVTNTCCTAGTMRNMWERELISNR